jgi:hypothetical protein
MLVPVIKTCLADSDNFSRRLVSVGLTYSDWKYLEPFLLLANKKYVNHPNTLIFLSSVYYPKQKPDLVCYFVLETDSECNIHTAFKVISPDGDYSVVVKKNFLGFHLKFFYKKEEFVFSVHYVPCSDQESVDNSTQPVESS